MIQGNGTNNLERSDSITLVHAGTDYLTLTSDKPGDMSMLYQIGTDLLECQFRSGNDRRPMDLYGYRGTQCGSVFVGTGSNGTMLRSSGMMSDIALMDVGDLEVHCTRIDLQITIRLRDDDEHYGYEEMRWAQRRRTCKESMSTAKLRHIIGNGEGDTAIVGSRSSVRYGRLYDKYRESGSKEFANCWRYELEYKREMAPRAFKAIRESSNMLGCIIALVRGQWNEWGFDIPVCTDLSVLLSGLGRPHSDAQTRLKWIESQVAPTIEKLAHAGYAKDVMRIVETRLQNAFDAMKARDYSDDYELGIST